MTDEAILAAIRARKPLRRPEYVVFSFIYQWSTTIFTAVYVHAVGLPYWAAIAAIAVAVAVDFLVVAKAPDLQEPIEVVTEFVRGQKELTPPPTPRLTLFYAAILSALLALILFHTLGAGFLAHLCLLVSGSLFLVFWNYEFHTRGGATLLYTKKAEHGRTVIDHATVSKNGMRALGSFVVDNPVFYVPILLFLASAVIFAGRRLGVEQDAHLNGFLLAVLIFLAVLAVAHQACVFWRYKAVAIAFGQLSSDQGKASK